MPGRALDDQGKEQLGEDTEDAPPFSIFQLEYLRKVFKAPEYAMPTSLDTLIQMGTQNAIRHGEIRVISHIANLVFQGRNPPVEQS